MRKHLICMILCLLLLACTPHARGAVFAGTEMPDFTVETTQGTVSLSGALAEKKAVVVNFWASWCGYCIEEFPLFQEAYEQFGEDVQFIALTVEAKDGDAQIRSVQQSLGLNFPMGRDTAGLGAMYVRGGIPVTLVVDRFGKIAYEQTGAFQRSSELKNLLSALTSDGYTESVVYTEPPAAQVTAAGETGDALSRALNAEGSSLVFANPDDAHTWPMQVFEDGTRTGVCSSNSGEDDTLSAVKTVLTSSEGEAFCVDVRSSSLGGLDVGQLIVDGTVVRVFSGERDWHRVVYPLEAGEHEVMLTYRKLHYGAEGQDSVWYSGACLAKAETEDVPERTEQAGIRVITPGALRVLPEKEGLFQDRMDVYLVEDDVLKVEFTLGQGMDEEALVITAGERFLSTSGMQTQDHVHFTAEIPVTQDMRDQETAFILLYPSAEEGYACAAACVLSEASLEEAMAGEKYILEPTAQAAAEKETAWYSFRFVDAEGRAVAGVRVNLCTDTNCSTLTSAEDGVASAEMEPGIYHVQLVEIPEGYAFDKNTVRYTARNGGDMEFVLDAAE